MAPLFPYINQRLEAKLSFVVSHFVLCINIASLYN